MIEYIEIIEHLLIVESAKNDQLYSVNNSRVMAPRRRWFPLVEGLIKGLILPVDGVHAVAEFHFLLAAKDVAFIGDEVY